MSLPKWVDAYMPPRGRCLVCGAPDARHRVTDAAWEALRAGDSMPVVAEEYGLPLEMVRRLFMLKRPPSPWGRAALEGKDA